MGGQIKKLAYRRVWKQRSYFTALLSSAKIALNRLLAPRTTVEYPEEHLLSPPRYRGNPRLLRDAQGRVKCTACHLCATACPAACIHLEAADAPWRDREKYPRRFEIDLGRCIFCGYCVDACPQEAIATSDRRVVAAEKRDDLVFDLDRLLNT